MTDTILPPLPVVPPQGTSQADVFRQMGTGLGFDPNDVTNIANVIGAASALRPKLSGNLQQDIQNDITRTGGKYVSAIQSAYQAPLQNAGLQSTTQKSQIDTQKAISSTQPFAFSDQQLSQIKSQREAAIKAGYTPDEVNAYIKQNFGDIAPIISPTNANELQQARDQINKMRDVDLAKDASSGAGHTDIINKHYDGLLNNLDPTESIKNTSNATAEQKRSDDFTYKVTASTFNDTLKNYINLPTKNLGSLGGVVNAPIIGKDFFGKAQEYEKQRNAIAIGAKNIFAGSGSNVRVNLPEISQWATLLPSVNKTKEQNAYDVQILNQNIKSRFGKGLDPAILKQYGGDNSLPPVTATSGKYKIIQIK